jgi:hypothetical protein
LAVEKPTDSLKKRPDLAEKPHPYQITLDDRVKKPVFYQVSGGFQQENLPIL